MTKGAPGRLRIRWWCPLCNSLCLWSDIRQISPSPVAGCRLCSISLHPHASFSRVLLCSAACFRLLSGTATLLMCLFGTPRRFFIPRTFAPEASFRRPPLCAVSGLHGHRTLVSDVRELPFPVPHLREAVSPGLHASPEVHRCLIDGRHHNADLSTLP